MFRRSRTRGGTRRQIVVVSSDDEPLVPARRVQATQIDPELSQTIPSTVPATPESLAHAGREIPSVPLDVLDALEHDLAPHPVQHVEETQVDAPSFVHATRFNAFLVDTDVDEEAGPACDSSFPPPVIHHTMFSPSDPDSEASEGGLDETTGVGTTEPNANQHQVEGGDSHDERLVRVRLRWSHLWRHGSALCTTTNGFHALFCGNSGRH